MGEVEAETKKWSYPGPINNYLILNFKDFWFDPLETEKNTNIFVGKNMVESTNYVIVPQNIYKIFKNNFGAINEIRRKAIVFNDDLMVDVHLIQV